MNGVSIFAYSDKGCLLAQKISGYIGGDIHSTKKFADKYGIGTIDSFGDLFDESAALIFVCACGIAVRTIAPYIKSKLTDPAVIVIDDNANFVIPILSGHIGGANELAREIADKLGSAAAITTATDINNRFSADTWAVKNNCVIGNMNMAKQISAAILTSDVNLTSDFPIVSRLPNGVVLNESGEFGICISYKNHNPYAKTLRLIPKILHIGIGCRRDKTFAEIDEFFVKVTADINIAAIKSVSSIDIKRNESGLLEFAETYRLPIHFYSADELNELDDKFTQSEFVKSVTGVDNVCERAAFKSADGGDFIMRKTSFNGITIAICAEDWSVNFE